MVIYPPKLERKFVSLVQRQDGKIELIIPYIPNRANNLNDFTDLSYQALIKSIPTNNNQLELFNGMNGVEVQTNIANQVTFIFDDQVIRKSSLEQMYIGNFYKIQLALKSSSSDVDYYYSTAVIIKYTNKPTLEIKNYGQIFEGIFTSSDSSEYLSSSKFILFQTDNTKLEESEEIYYINFDSIDKNDENYIMKQSYEFKYYLIPGESYKVKWETTSNSGAKNIIEQIIVSEIPEVPLYILTPKVELDYENGIINIGIEYGGTEPLAPQILGNFQLTKASSLDNFTSWSVVSDFTDLTTEHLSTTEVFKILIQDYNINQGEFYKYGLSQVFNEGNTLRKMMRFESENLYADFEHFYLCDEDKQLKIAFNPKISTFKEVILESKTDTIGGQYPYFFRNGQVKYKEFSISGLISYLQDPDKLFVDLDNLQYNTNLTSDVVYKERLFKQKVLEWLNNGKTKLLKTATEGNYFVRLMNVSLSPNDTLGRMLHTFSATAYEVESENKDIYRNNYYPIETRLEFKTIRDGQGLNKFNNRTYTTSSNNYLKQVVFSNLTEDINITISGFTASTPRTSVEYSLTIGKPGYKFISPPNVKLNKITISPRLLEDMVIDTQEVIYLSKVNNISVVNQTEKKLKEIFGMGENKSFKYYKYIQFVVNQYPLSIDEEAEKVELIDATGKIKTYIVKDQLIIRNAMLKIENLGNNISAQYCILENEVTN